MFKGKILDKVKRKSENRVTSDSLQHVFWFEHLAQEQKDKIETLKAAVRGSNERDELLVSLWPRERQFVHWS